jgi:carbon-monoxide dehydrogenase large subunit
MPAERLPDRSKLVRYRAQSVLLAARKVMDKAIKIAAHNLEANEKDLVYQDGKVSVKGSEEKFMTLAQISRSVTMPVT